MTRLRVLSNRGYAVLQPNFRGSTGYGKKFLNAGNGEWGRKMQDDLTWGVKALVADGTVDAKRVGISGGSYGGYATLAGVAFTPDVYAAAVAIVAPSNLITLLDAIPPYWEAGRKQMYTRMADPTTPEGKALLMAESPLTQAKAIVTPLMVVQGKNDPRVNIRESNQIVAAVRDNGKPVEYLVAPDEGPRLCTAHQQSGHGDCDGGVLCQISWRTLAGRCSARGGGQAERDDRGSEDSERGRDVEGCTGSGGAVDGHAVNRYRDAAHPCRVPGADSALNPKSGRDF